jgi:hypothetical protein
MTRANTALVLAFISIIEAKKELLWRVEIYINTLVMFVYWGNDCPSIWHFWGRNLA